MRVYLIRHAESLKNKEGLDRTAQTPLSENGIKQAESVAGRIANITIDVIYSSSYQRAKQTAAIISKVIDKPIEYWDHLIEANTQKETFEELNLRSEAILNHLLAHHKDQNVLCISHASMIEMVIGKMVFGGNLSLQIMLDIKKHFGATNTGISVCEFTEKDGWVLQTFNDFSHL